MRITWTFACALIALGCARSAVGAGEPFGFNLTVAWLWWVAVAFWAIAALRTAAGWYDD